MEKNLIDDKRACCIYRFFAVWTSVIVLLCINTVLGHAEEIKKFDGEIVFARADNGFNIFKINGANPNKAIQLTYKKHSSTGNDIGPRWSPSGDQIAFINRESLGKSNIFIIDSEGRNKVQITSFNDGIIFNLKWDRDGKRIYFNYNPNKPEEKITEKVINIKTKVIKDIPENKESLRACDRVIQSPNGESLICVKWLMPGSEKFTVYQAETLSWIDHVLTKIKELVKKVQGTISYKDITYKMISETTLKNASDPLWSKDSLQFAVTIGDQLMIFDKLGHQLSQASGLCKNEGSVCLRSWPNVAEKILFSCYCGAEEVEEKIYLIELDTLKTIFISKGQNPDWYFRIK